MAALDPATPRLAEAARLFRQMVEAEELDEFMTSVALPELETSSPIAASEPLAVA